MLEDKFQIILDRIKAILEVKSDADAARGLEITPQALSQFRGKNKFPYELLIKFCFRHTIVIDWLLTGEGAKHRWELKAYEEKVCEASEGYDGRRVDVFAFAGAGNPTEPSEYESIDQMFIPNRFWKASILPVRVWGKSMEPTIMDGATVGIDREDKWIVSGEVYAVWLPYEGAVVKRIFLDTEKLTLKSDNLNFPDIFVPLQKLDDNFIQGRVKWVIQQLR